MTELLKYLKDARFYVPLAFLVGFELFLQSGLYKNLLRYHSYAANVNRIVERVGGSKLNPDILILGTSVAYQGLNMPLLNQELGAAGITAQSGACEGAKPITQHLIYRSLKRKLPGIKTVILVSEVTFPWAERRGIDEPNRGMIAELDWNDAEELLDTYKIDLSRRDYFFFHIRTLTYQRDLRDFVLDPGERLKDIGRRLREQRADPAPLYAYENKEKYGISAFSKTDLQTCINNAGNMALFPRLKARGVTDRHHRRAVHHTCYIGLHMDPMRQPGAAQWNKLFFQRLKAFHDEIRADGRRVVTVFAPYASLIQDMNANERLELWRQNLREIHGDDFTILDLRRSLDGPDNGDLFYDTIHLNKFGAERFTRVLAREIIKYKDDPRLGLVKTGGARG